MTGRREAVGTAGQPRGSSVEIFPAVLKLGLTSFGGLLAA
jgi:hypothetical protein